MAGPFSPADFHELIPPDKKLDPAWVESLFARGEPTVYGGPGRRAELEKIGMPIGGICAGQLYLGGDGKLWHWDILNRHAKTSEGAYVHPPKPASPLDQGFAIRVRTNGKSVVKALDHTGFETITFRGEYPIGRVEYRDRTLPVSVSLEAFSPFIPLNADDSGLPATIMRFTLKNTGKEAVEADIAGWLENAVCLYSKPSCTLANTITRRSGTTCLECRALPPEKADQPDIVFDDFEDGTFGRWTVAGNAFGKTPISTADSGRYVAPAKAGGKFFAFSMHEVPDNSAMGTLTSKTFTIERDYIVFQICGGNHKEKTCVNLLVDGKVVDSIVGPNGPRMSVRKFDVKALRGETAQLQIVDAADRPTNWRGGYIGVDAITFTNTPLNSVGRYCEEFDYGTLTLAVLEGAGEELAIASLPAGKLPDVLFADQGLAQGGAARRQIREEKPRGAVGRAMRLAPGAEQTVSFVIAWNFPNLVIEDGGPGHGGIHLEDEGNHYATRFRNATATVEYLVANLGRLTDQTRLWHDTWYDSTLPYWFLDRTFANTSTLASSTCIRFAGGRFWGWEGVDCCPGTCTHVWHYAQAVGRVFPELERIVRERVDFGLAFDEKTGKIMYRGEKERESNLYGLSRDGSAVDGQAGTILRVYREHQMSADNAFLRRIWPKVKRGLDWLIAKDADGDGLIEASQHNTLDRDLHGPSSWLSSLYVAALRAGEAMARELGDVAFAEKVAPVAASGSRKIAGELFNGEYFIHKPAREGGVGYGPGCEIDQVFGQGWAHQVNLGRILPKDKTLSALRSLWKYNFAFDVGPYFKKHAGGRVFARPGEAGLIMCTWPQGGRPSGRAYGGDLYSECMHGFEYQAAGHMIFEGLVKEGLAVTRSVHDRYHPVKRNPWNEIECGEHYARSMASYGIFLAACGFEYHGPGGHIGFAPALTPENFKAAFIGAEGWGTFAQKDKVGRRNVALAVKWGKLRLRTLSLGATSGTVPRSADASLNGKAVDCTLGVKHGKATLTFDVNTILKAGQTLDVLLK